MSENRRPFVFESECPCGHTVNIEIGAGQRRQGEKAPYIRCAECGRIVVGKPQTETFKRG